MPQNAMCTFGGKAKWQENSNGFIFDIFSKRIISIN